MAQSGLHILKSSGEEYTFSYNSASCIKSLHQLLRCACLAAFSYV